eukprot:CAMPEP_0184658578 /NCGR_PEP_ID=MMETSP0308-20130426/26030_1 /TAXON_ID=38269 /ORGANISM="Gloeochaete witrockiana, Strain SAG 46.84" /LENGTH=236 /DNA_ID=CAMNT_0027097689 /DNA_START=42 /DNA_END=752 /DNA_ORIENTATION=+
MAPGFVCTSILSVSTSASVVSSYQVCSTLSTSDVPKERPSRTAFVGDVSLRNSFGSRRFLRYSRQESDTYVERALVVCEAPRNKKGKESKESIADRFKQKNFAVAPTVEEKNVFELKPHFTEVLGGAAAAISVVGAPILLGALSRQAWVRYNISDRRVTVMSGFMGKERFDVSYPNIEKLVYVKKGFGTCADIVLSVKGGAKVELRSCPNYEAVISFILSQMDEDARADTGDVAKL